MHALISRGAPFKEAGGLRARRLQPRAGFNALECMFDGAVPPLPCAGPCVTLLGRDGVFQGCSMPAVTKMLGPKPPKSQCTVPVAVHAALECALKGCLHLRSPEPHSGGRQSCFPRCCLNGATSPQRRVVRWPHRERALPRAVRMTTVR